MLRVLLAVALVLAPVFAHAQDFPGQTFGTTFRGGASLTGARTLSFAPVVPASITGNQNNYNPGAVSNLYRISSTGNINITGWVAAVDGWQMCVENVGASVINLTGEDALSTAVNRFRNNSGGAVQLQPNGGTACYLYNVSTVNRWVYIGGPNLPNTTVGGSLSVAGSLSVNTTTLLSGDLDARGAISNGSSNVCDSLGLSGTNCINDNAGTVITVNTSAANSESLIVKGPAVASQPDPIQTWRTGETATGWATLNNSTLTAGVFAPGVFTRAIGANQPGLSLSGGVEAANDTGTAPVIGVECRREAGTPTTLSGSVITTRPCIETRNFGTVISGFHTNGRQGLSTISPTALAADVNDYAGCTTTAQCRIDSGAAVRNITGITPGYTATLAALFWVCAVGANNLTLVHESASSAAANRFTFNGATNRTVLAGSCFPLMYDLNTQRHRAANGT